MLLAPSEGRETAVFVKGDVVDCIPADVDDCIPEEVDTNGVVVEGLREVVL